MSKKNTVDKKTNLVQKPKESPIISANSKPLNVWISVIGLFAFTLFVFSFGFKHQFVEWDDQLYVRDNILVSQPTMEHFFKAFRSSVALNYHPLTIISLWLNAKLSGVQSASPFIITNAVIHALNVVIVYFISLKISKNNQFVGFVTAILFAIHPMKVESVTWVAERKDVLYAFFFLLSMFSYLKFQENKLTKYSILTFVFFVCSCMSKGQAVVLPIVLLLLDYYQNNLSVKKVVEKWPYFIVAFVFGLIALNIQAGGNFHGLTEFVPNQKTALDLNVFSFVNRLIFAGYSFMMYIVNFVFPHNLGPFHPYLDFKTPEGTSYYYGLPFVFLTVLLVYISSKKSKLLVFGIGFYFISVALVLQFISVGTTIISDRYSYLPYFGLTFLLASVIYKLTELQDGKLKILAYVLPALIVGIWSFQTISQIKIWENSISLYSRMIENYPEDYRPYGTRGKMIGMAGDLEGGIKDLEKSISLGSKESGTYSDLGTAYAMKGQIDKAVVNFTKAINLGDATGEPYLNRGIAFMNSDPAQSLADFEKALSLLPARELDIRTNMSILYLNQNQNDKALENINMAIDLGSQNPSLWQNRGEIKEKKGDILGAIADFQKALELGTQNEYLIQKLDLLKTDKIIN